MSFTTFSVYKLAVKEKEIISSNRKKTTHTVDRRFEYLIKYKSKNKVYCEIIDMLNHLKESELTDNNKLIEAAKVIFENFNDTLKPYENKRTFISIHTIDYSVQLTKILPTK